MEYRNINELHKLDRNPRTIKDKDMARLIQSIRDNPKYFEARPLILSDRTGKLVILGGNQRFEACKFLKMEFVPTHLISGLTEQQEREIIIRDNVSNGEWDWDLLANEWDSLELDKFGVSVWQDIPMDDLEFEEQKQEEEKIKRLVFKFPQSVAESVKEKLLRIDDKIEIALLKLLENA